MKYHPNSVNIDDPKIRQALLDLQLTQDQADVIENSEYLDPDFVNGVLIPQLVAIKTDHEAQKLLSAFQTNAELQDLVQKFTFTQFQKDVKPDSKTPWETLRSSLNNGMTALGRYFEDLKGIQDQNERLNALNSEIIRRAKRIMDKFDQYVIRGDGIQYGDDRDWLFRDDEEVNATDVKEVRKAPEDMSRNQMVEVINSIVIQARNDELTVKLGDNTLPRYRDKEHKMRDLLARLEMIETGVDDVLPGYIEWVSRKGADLAKSGLGAGLDGFYGVIDEIIWANNLVIATVVWWIVYYKTDKLAIDSIARKIPVIGSRLRKPATATPSAPGSPSPSPKTAPKKPRGYVSLDLSIPKGSVLHTMQPGSSLHELFRDTIQSKLTTADQKTAYDKLSKNFNAGKFSREEYFRRIQLIIANKHTIGPKLAKLWPGHSWGYLDATTGNKYTKELKKAANVVTDITTNTVGLAKNVTLKTWEKMLGGLYAAPQTVTESRKWNIRANISTKDFRIYPNLAWKEVALPHQDRINLYKDLEASLYEYDKLREYKTLNERIVQLENTQRNLPKKTPPDQVQRIADQIADLTTQRSRVNILHAWESIDVALARVETAVNKAMQAIDDLHAAGTPHATKFRANHLFNTALHDANKTTSILETVLKALAKR